MSVLVMSDSFVVRDVVGNLLKGILNTDKLKSISSIDDIDINSLNELDFIFIDIKKENVYKLSTVYELKNNFIYTIRKLVKGNRFYDSDVTKLILDSINKSGIDILTGREKEVLSKIADGFNNKDIDYKLNITECTVKKHT